MAVRSQFQEEALAMDVLRFYAGEGDALHRDMEQAALHFKGAGDFQGYRGILLAYAAHFLKSYRHEGAIAHFFGKDDIKTVDDVVRMVQTQDRYLFLLSDNVQSLYGGEGDALRADMGKAALLSEERGIFQGYRDILLAYVRYFQKEVNCSTASRFLEARAKLEFQEWEKRNVHGKA